MDGIFVAYHNVKRIFGFQYMNLDEMDRALHGQSDRNLGNQEFSLSIDLLNKILDKATEKFPEQSLRFHFETRQGVLPFMYVFAEPMSEEDIDTIQNSQKARIAEYERSVMGLEEQETSADVDKEDSSVTDPSPSLSSQTTEIESGSLKMTETDPLASQQPSEESTTQNNDQGHPPTVLTEDSSDSPTGRPSLSFLEPDSASTNSSPNPSSSPTDTLEENLRPLLARTLTVRSKVNGSYVERPEDLKPSDDWTIEYSMTELATPSRSWALYEASKGRRRKIYERMSGGGAKDKDKDKDKETSGDDLDRSAKRSRDYIDMLRELSRKGTALREQIEKIELEREKVVVGAPYGKVDEAKDASAVKIEGVDDYLGWLWKNGPSH